MEFFSICNGIVVHISDNCKKSDNYDNTIILLHGYLETLYIWEDFIPYLGDNSRIVSIDLPGHGMSGSFDVNTMEQCARTVVSVMDKLKIDKAWIAGHSMGGYVLSETVKLFGSRFNGLIMLHSTTYADSEEKKENRTREISLINQNKLSAVVKFSVPLMFAPLNRVKMEEKIMEISEISEVHDPQGISSSIKGMMQREDNTEAMASCALPKLFVFGNEDHYIPVETAEILVAKIPGAVVHYMPGCGHNSFLENPVETASLITNFIKENA